VIICVSLNTDYHSGTYYWFTLNADPRTWLPDTPAACSHFRQKAEAHDKKWSNSGQPGTAIARRQ
jgi:hypothetical protein